jgi:methyl-accepting chemotaxis protein
MAKPYLADQDRYVLYGLDRPQTMRVLQRIRGEGLDFVRAGLSNFIARLSTAPGVGETYRDNQSAILDFLTEHYERIISPDFAAVHSESNRRTVARLFEIGTDMRALFASASFLLEAYARRPARRWRGPWRGIDERYTALQRVFICDAATAFTYDQHRIMAEAEARNARLTDQLADFRALIEGVSGELNQASGSVEESLAIVSDAASRALGSSRAAADANQLGNRNLTSSAASTEELAISINEVTRQSQKSRDVVGRAEQAVESARSAIGALETSAETIGSIVDLISRVAEQTNLLSLNATIEAARAGEAGRGFAVVAQEVKALASQTTKATEDIVEQINAVQNAAARSVQDIGAIGGTMAELSRAAGEVAAAIAQQNGLTSELSRNLHDAVKQVVQASDGHLAASALIEGAGAETERLREAVAQLSRIGASLVHDVDSFSARIKAA